MENPTEARPSPPETERLMRGVFYGTVVLIAWLMWKVVGPFALAIGWAISRLPVIVSDRKTAGWSALVRTESGGGAPPSYVRHAFDGKQCVEKERTPGDKAPEGTRHLAGELAFDNGIPLEPRN